MSNITFEYPYVFLLLAIFLLCAFFCKAKSEAIIFPHLDIFMQSSESKTIWIKVLKWIAIISAITALASPIKEDKMEVHNKEGYAIALVLDASGSMERGFERMFGSISQSKFDISMEMAQAFVEKRENDQLALVVFGDFAYVAAPLTYDKKIIWQIMGGLRAGIAGRNQTVINDALFQSAKLFKSSDAKTKIVILLTDGQSRGDNVPFDVAMRLAQQYNIKVYTIGIGNKGEFNQEHLEIIANKSGGQFFSANDKDALAEIYNKIDKLEKSQIKSQKYVKKSYYFEYPLFLAFVALLFFIYLRNIRGLI